MPEKYVAGVDLGGTKIYTALAGEDGGILAEIKIPTEAEKGLEHVVGLVVDSVRKVRAEAGVSPANVRAVAVGVPGLLDSAGEIVRFAPNLDWHEIPLKKMLMEKLQVPVFIENDANLAALGEHVYGAGRGKENLVYITVSTGVGGGLIIGGKVYRGFSGCAGEIGHMTVLPEGPVCSCGNSGCLEAVASGTAIAREAAEAIALGGGKQILAEAGGDPEAITSAHVAAAAAKGDPDALRIITAAARFLGIGAANILNLLNPSLVVLGGGVMGAGDFFLEYIKNEAGRRSFQEALDGSRIVRSELGGRAGVLGAIALALRATGRK